MSNIKENKEHYERVILLDIKALTNEIESNGWTRSTYTTFRLLKDDMERLEALDFFDRD